MRSCLWQVETQGLTEVRPMQKPMITHLPTPHLWQPWNGHES